MVLYLRRLEFINSVASAMIGGNDFFGVGLFGGFLFICVGGTGALMSRYITVVGPAFNCVRLHMAG